MVAIRIAKGTRWVDPDGEDASKRYKMSYFDWGATDGDEYPCIHVAFSPDGVHWRKHETGPLSKMAYGKGEFGVDVPHTDGTSEPWLIPLSMSDAVDSMWEKAPVSTMAFEGARVRSCRRRC